MRFRLADERHYRAEIHETTGEDGRRSWSIELTHTMRDGFGPEEQLLRCDGEELRELVEVFQNPAREGERFRMRIVEAPSALNGDKNLKAFLSDEQGQTVGMNVGRTVGDVLRYEEMEGFLGTVGRFVEARRSGVELGQWCHEEGIEMRPIKPRLEPDTHTMKHRHTL